MARKTSDGLGGTEVSRDGNVVGFLDDGGTEGGGDVEAVVGSVE